MTKLTKMLKRAARAHRLGMTTALGRIANALNFCGESHDPDLEATPRPKW